MSFKSQNIPAPLKVAPQWVCYRRDKTPVDPKSGQAAKANDPNTWGTFEQAVRHFEKHKQNGIAGIGREFSFYDAFCGLDLDHCRNPQTGEIEAWAREIVERFASYTEISPSGTGLHIWIKGKLPPGADHQKNLPGGGKIEVYDCLRYFTVTGHHVKGTPATVQDRDKELKSFYAQVIAKPKAPPKSAGPGPTLSLADSEIIEKARSAQNGNKFDRLMQGDTSDYGGDDSSADLALCCLLAFWTQDPDQIDRIFRTSGLSRDKWERADYRERTINKALAGVTETFKPRSKPQATQEKTEQSPDPDDYDRLEREAIQSEKSQKPKLFKGILEIDQLASIELPERKKYLHPWLMESSINMICAPKGTGKTMLGLSIGEAVARGASFGPWGAGESVNVLYLDGELVLGDIQERANYFRQTSYQSKFYVYSTHHFNLLGLPNANLGDETWRTEMTKLLKYLNIKLWFIDNIASLTPGIDENVKHAWDPINQWFLQLRFAGISTVFLHHTGKEKSQRGTSGREDNIDISIMLELPKGYYKEDGCRFIAKFEKARIRQRELHLIADSEFALVVDDSGKHTWTFSYLRVANKKAILELLDQGKAQKDIAESLGVDKGYVSRIKNQAVRDGFITADGKLTQSGYVFIHGS